MTLADEPNREKDLFGQALDVPSPAERLAFLNGACGADAALLARVQALLEAHEAAQDFLPDQPHGRSPHNPVTEKPGDRIGRYKLREKIGEGGCGVVYVAEQEVPVRRKVALKVIKLGMDTRAVVARFEAERQALAIMDHPNIAKVFDAGSTDTGRPYFVMELVRGVKISDFCDQNRLSTRERLDLFTKVCQAVQHAHQKGIIHRDLKPSNILVTVSDPNSPGVPKVIDFGIAKATEGRLTAMTVYTDLRQFIGTPAYMSPEQASMTSLDIDTRSDIYSLGVLLYELLTGHTPFDTKELMVLGVDDLRRTIREKEPMRPSTRLSTMRDGELTAAAKYRASEPPKLIHLMRGDLDWIVMKCLEKDRAGRYETANGLALDIQRHLNDEPVMARPPGKLYRLQKLARRNKLAFAATGAVLGALVLGVAGSTWQAVRARRAEHEQGRLRANETQLRQDAEAAKRTAQTQAKRAESAALEAKTTLAASDFLQALRFIADGNGTDALPYLVRSLAANPGNQAVVTRMVTLLAYNRWAMPKLTLEHEKLLSDARFSPDGKRIVTASFDNTARVWDAQSGLPLTEPLKHGKTVNSARFSTDGRWIATASWDGTARLWDAQTGQPLARPLLHHDVVWQAEFSPDGKRVVTASSDKTAQLWNTQSGLPLTGPLRHQDIVWTARFSPDGTRVVTASQDQTAKVWDAHTGQLLAGPLRHKGAVFSARFSPDGNRIVTASADQTARVWDARTGQPLTEALRHQKDVYSAEFSPDGKCIVTASWDRTARVWDAQAGLPLTPPLRHQQEVCSAQFSLDGKRVLTASWDETARVWDAQSGLPLAEPLKHQGLLHAAQFSPDGKVILTAAGDGLAWLWDAPLGKSLPEALAHHDAVRFAQFSPDGKRIVTASDDETARVWDALTGAPLTAPYAHKGKVVWAQFSPDGERIVTASEDQTARVWSAQTAQPLTGPFEHEGAVNLARFSPDGGRVVTASVDHTARVWNAKTGLPLTSALRHEAAVVSAEFSPDGKWIVTASEDRTGRIWDAQSGQPTTLPLTHQGALHSARFSSDGRRVVTASDDFTARVWDALTGQPVTGPIKHEFNVVDAEFSPDGKRIVTAADSDWTARVWDAQNGLPLTELMFHQTNVVAAQFSPDGKRVLTVSGRTAWVWDAQSGLPLAEPFSHGGEVTSAHFSPDSKRMVTASLDGTARVWDIAPSPSHCPDWLPKIAGAISGQRLDKNGVFEGLAWNDRAQMLNQVRETPNHSNGEDDWVAWGRWFLAKPFLRTISPFSRVPLAQYIDDRIAEQTAESLAEAESLVEGNTQLLSRIADRWEMFDRTNRPAMLAIEARKLADQGNLAEAEATYREAVALNPRSAALYQARGDFLARCSKWKEACADFSRAIELEPDNDWPYPRLASALVQSGDLEAYPACRGRILTVFGAADNPAVCERMAKSCLILPLSGSDLTAVGKIADRAVARGKYHYSSLFFQFAKGLAEYRAGHLAPALDLLGKVAAGGTSSDSEIGGTGTQLTAAFLDAQACFVLAMVQWKLNHPEEARAAALKGAHIINSQVPNLDSGGLDAAWHDWIIAHALRKEAEELIK